MALIVLTVQRKRTSSLGILGEMSVSRPFSANSALPTVPFYTLERPHGEIFNPIPTGTYPAFVRVDGHLGWRLELRHVPHRTNIQIHVGNTIENSTGCILLGTQMDGYTVLNSKKAMQALKYEIEHTESPDIRVVVQ